MGNSYPILEKEAIDYLCGLIRNITNITDSLDDLHVRTDGTFSSHKIDTLLQIILNEANEYTDQITSALVRITAEEMTEEPTLDNTTDKINTLIIYSPNGDTNYNQYLRLENKLIDFGPAEIDMSNVYTKEQANAKFALVTDIEGIIDAIGSENMGTTATTLKGAIKEVKETVDNIEPSVEISWADYQALSEAEKNNGTVYYIPDMPVSTSGEAIGEVERLNCYLVRDVTLSVGDVIPFVADSDSNIEINNGLVTLKKGKTYSIFADLRLGFSDNDRFCFYGLKDDEGNTYGSRGYDSSNNRDVLYGAHTSIKYTLTPTKDIKICVYLISGGDTSISAYASTAKLTITEIPSLQACIDVSDEHIKEVANEWKLFKSVTGDAKIDISSLLDKNELLIESISSNSSFPCDFSIIVLPRNLTSQNSVRPLGYYNNSSDYGSCKFLFNTSIAKLLSIAINGTNITSNCTVNLYYR